MSAELAEMKSLLQSHHLDMSALEYVLSSPSMPVLHAKEDVLSLAASASDFREEVSKSGDSSMQDVMRLALGHIHLEVPQAGDLPLTVPFSDVDALLLLFLSLIRSIRGNCMVVGAIQAPFPAFL